MRLHVGFDLLISIVQAAPENEVTSVAGRVAAASLAFSGSRNSSASASPPPVAQKPSSVSNLTSVKVSPFLVHVRGIRNLAPMSHDDPKLSVSPWEPL